MRDERDGLCLKLEWKRFRLTPGAVLRGQVILSHGFRWGLRATILFILAPKQPSPLVSHEDAAAYSTNIAFTTRGHREWRPDDVPPIVRDWELKIQLCQPCHSQPDERTGFVGWKVLKVAIITRTNQWTRKWLRKWLTDGARSKLYDSLPLTVLQKDVIKCTLWPVFAGRSYSDLWRAPWAHLFATKLYFG